MLVLLYEKACLLSISLKKVYNFLMMDYNKAKKEVKLMRKVVLLLVALLLTFGLFACGSKDDINFPKFKESNAVELSASQMMALFEEIDITTMYAESIEILTKGYIKVLQSSDTQDTSYLWSNEVNITIDAKMYALMSEVVGNARMHVEGTLDYYQSTIEKDSTYEYNDTNAIKGTLGFYFYNNFLYMNVNGQYSEDGKTFKDAKFKQKLNQELNQTMWDQALSEIDADQISNRVPEQLLGMLENGDFEGIMEAIPNLKVYQDGTTYSIVFSVTKQLILDSITEIMTAYATAIDENITAEQIQSTVDQIITQVNEVVSKLEFTYVISIKGNKIVQMAEMLIFKSVDGKIDINMTTVIKMGVELPKFPTDLNTYTPVDEPGEGIFTDSSTKR